MPTLIDPGFLPTPLLRGGHRLTLATALFRKVPTVPWNRQRLETPDQDFIDVDSWLQGSENLVILSHGLEGDSTRPYLRGMAHALRTRGYDLRAWNMRGCSGEPNRLSRYYHSGWWQDLELVVQKTAEEKKWKQIFLVGFSVGGNITLRFLALSSFAKEIKRAAVVSAPIDLRGSSEKLARLRNYLYMAHFLESLRQKARWKMERGLKEWSLPGYLKHRTFKAYDDAFTAPLFGYTDAHEYWANNSAQSILDQIKTPTLFLTAADDPFLSPSCYPTAAAVENPYLHLLVTKYGGHCGFLKTLKSKESFAETEVNAFIR